jgi:hypothetical protein
MTQIELIATARRYPALWNTEGCRIFGPGWSALTPMYRVNGRRLYAITIGSIIVDAEIPYRVEAVRGALACGDDGRVSWRYVAQCLPLAESCRRLTSGVAPRRLPAEQMPAHALARPRPCASRRAIGPRLLHLSS